jgi:regulator of replication initiation timing
LGRVNAVLEAKLERRDKKIVFLKTDLEASKDNEASLQFDNEHLQVENDRLREEIAALKASKDTHNNHAFACPNLVHLSTTAIPHHVSSASDAIETVAAGAAAAKFPDLYGLCLQRTTILHFPTAPTGVTHCSHAQ